MRKRKHCSDALVNAVASVLTAKPSTSNEILQNLPAVYSTRAIRYAVDALIDQGRARRIYNRGPVCSMPSLGVVAVPAPTEDD